MTHHGDLLNPPVLLPDDPAVDRRDAGDDLESVAGPLPRGAGGRGGAAPRMAAVTRSGMTRTGSRARSPRPRAGRGRVPRVVGGLGGARPAGAGRRPSRRGVRVRPHRLPPRPGLAAPRGLEGAGPDPVVARAEPRVPARAVVPDEGRGDDQRGRRGRALRPTAGRQRPAGRRRAGERRRSSPSVIRSSGWSPGRPVPALITAGWCRARTGAARPWSWARGSTRISP